MGIKLTRAQMAVKKLLLANEGSVIIAHRKMTGTMCYRLMTFDHSPVKNIRYGVLRHLYNKGVVIKSGAEYMINPTIKKAGAIKQQPESKTQL